MMNRLILLRHGESLWNLANRFTGWVDIPLSKKGIDEALAAGKSLKDWPIDCIFVSNLERAIQTAMIAMAEHGALRVPVIISDEPFATFEGSPEEIIPVYRSKALNERMYGKLQGLNKAATVEKFGKEQVQIWRRSFSAAPPGGESLKECAARTIPYFEESIMPKVKAGQNVLVVAHGNSLRSIIMDIDRLTEDEVVHLELATGVPVVYTFDGNALKR